MINLRHHGIAPKTKFLVRKTGVEIDDRKRRVGEKLVGPVGAHLRTLRPGERRAIAAHARNAALPFDLGVPHEAVRADVEHVIRDGDFAGGVGGVGAVVAEHPNPVGVRDIHKIGGELGETVAAVVKRVASAGLDHHVADALVLVKEHQAVLVGHAVGVAAEVVGAVHDGINPLALAEIGRINAAIANGCAGGTRGDEERENLDPNSEPRRSPNRRNGFGARVCDPQRIATPETFGSALPRTFAKVLRVTDPRSVRNVNARSSTDSASISD